MKTQLLALALVGTSVLFGAGCNIPFMGCDSAQSSNYAAATFTPSSSAATRLPASCEGSTTYQSADTLTLDLTGDTSAPPYTTMTIQIKESADIAASFPLVIDTTSTPNVTTAEDTQGLVHFSLTQGANASEIDSSTINAVNVTVESMPYADGQTLGLEIKIYYLDGSVLDQTYEAQTSTAKTLCANPQ